MDVEEKQEAQVGGQYAPLLASESSPQHKENKHQQNLRVKTGTIWTGTAHIITGVIGAGVLSLSWSIAQLGWVAGIVALFVFAGVTLISVFLVCDCYRFPDPRFGPYTNSSYMQAVRHFLGCILGQQPGAKKRQIREEVRYLQKFQQPDLVFLLETMASDVTAKQILPQLGFDYFDYSLPVNHSGGLWVLWNNKNILANVLLKEDRAIYMLVFDVSSQKFSIISGVYAPAQPNQKDVFWSHLKDLNGVIDKPWCIIGDFNELECSTDKVGGPPVG